MPTEATMTVPRLRPYFRIAALVLAALQTYGQRHAMNPDGISYLDLGDALWSGSTGSAVSTYWSPLYPWLIGTALRLVQPSAYWEFAAVKVLNYLIFVAALAAFEWLLNEVGLFWKADPSQAGRPNRALGPQAFENLAYWVFITASIRMISLGLVTPDLLVSANVYCGAALLTRSRRLGTTPVRSAALGAVLGFGFLSKAAMFPLGMVLLATSLVAIGNWRLGLQHLGIAGLTFLLVASSWVAAMSEKIGRPTLGEVSALNYMWYVNGLNAYCWTGGSASCGTPLHPPRQVLSEPVAVYEFGQPVAGTYPIWFDPPYWCRGLVPHFELGNQLRTLNTNRREVSNYVSEQYLMLTLGIVLLQAAGVTGGIGPWRARAPAFLKAWAGEYLYWFPAFAAVGMYSLVHIEPRFLGGFVVLLVIGALGSLRPQQPSQADWFAMTTLVLSYLAAAAVCVDAAYLARGMALGERAGTHSQWEIADSLQREYELQPGMEVGVIGNAFICDWARIARLRIIAQVEPAEVDRFWKAEDTQQQRVAEAFRQAGAKALIAPSASGISAPWQRIRNSNYWILKLSEPQR